MRLQLPGLRPIPILCLVNKGYDVLRRQSQMVPTLNPGPLGVSQPLHYQVVCVFGGKNLRADSMAKVG